MAGEDPVPRRFVVAEASAEARRPARILRFRGRTNLSMAWNEPGGDGKRRDPWQGGGGDPPDLERLLQRWRERLGRIADRKSVV